MKLGEKLRYLREVEGNLRGLERAMTQQELVRALRAETGAALSQSYLSQIESGARPHMTNTTRQVLAKFFKVHPGYLVDDPEGYHVELQSDARALEDKLDLWLISGAERFRRDRELRQALLGVSRHADSRRCLMLLNAVIETPGLVDRLFEVLGSSEDKGREERNIPRGLKPTSFSARIGTAEAVPLQSRTSTTAGLAGRVRRGGKRPSREATQ
jgi:transcriptional regulator with XRE-family HTH domain